MRNSSGPSHTKSTFGPCWSPSHSPPAQLRGVKPANFPHTAWMLLEHLRLAQRGIRVQPQPQACFPAMAKRVLAEDGGPAECSVEQERAAIPAGFEGDADPRRRPQDGFIGADSVGRWGRRFCARRCCWRTTMRTTWGNCWMCGGCWTLGKNSVRAGRTIQLVHPVKSRAESETQFGCATWTVCFLNEV